MADAADQNEVNQPGGIPSYPPFTLLASICGSPALTAARDHSHHSSMIAPHHTRNHQITHEEHERELAFSCRQPRQLHKARSSNSGHVSAGGQEGAQALVLLTWPRTSFEQVSYCQQTEVNGSRM